MAIYEWPVGERPREKLQERGAAALTDAELLAILIGSGTRGRSAVETAREALQSFGSLGEFMKAERQERARQLGPLALMRLEVALELGRRQHLDALRAPGMVSATSVATFLIAHLRDRRYEVFCCLHLNAQHRFVAFEELFRGTIDGAHVHVREVARQVMHHNSAAVIFAHNHPSGVPEPSAADVETTRSLIHGLELFDVRVLDHVVVGDGVCVSLAERGLL